MNTPKILVISLAAVLAITVASTVIAKRNAKPTVTPEHIKMATIPGATSESIPPPASPTTEFKPGKQGSTAPDVVNSSKGESISTQATSSVRPKRPKDPVQDPAARIALSFVGADPDAEAYWEGAINDPTLPPEERKDLIEDLNEDGLSDPKHPGLEDLPLILSRLQLIEELAPYAMDQVDADAFTEAYKDLNNMIAGKPVQ